MRVGGSLKYKIYVPVKEFRGLLLLGGEARFTQIGANALEPERVYKLPTVKPPASRILPFELEVNPRGAWGGSIVCVSGLEVRACA